MTHSVGELWGHARAGAGCFQYDEMRTQMDRVMVESGFLKQGQLVVFVAGQPVGRAGTTNLMKLRVGLGRVRKRTANRLGVILHNAIVAMPKVRYVTPTFYASCNW